MYSWVCFLLWMGSFPYAKCLLVWIRSSQNVLSLFWLFLLFFFFFPDKIIHHRCFWKLAPDHFLMTGQKPAVCFVAVSMVESWKTETVFSIQTKPSPTATASTASVGMCEHVFLLAENSREQNADFCSTNLYSWFQATPLNVTAFSLWCCCPLWALG